jgi:RNA polymerase sigma factor for flagellar operon FliA
MSIITQKLKKLKDYRNTKDPQVKDKIIVEYAPLVKFIAQKIASRLPSNIELDDLISCGVIGLMDAIDKFDATRENKFKTYAEFRIRGSILDELRSQDWVPRSVRDKAKTLERAYAKLESKLGRTATEQEMCEELNCSMEEFHDLINKSKSVSLLNIDESSTFKRGDKKLLISLAEGVKGNNPFATVNYRDIQETLKEGIKTLPEKQRLVLSLYYYEDLNLKEIGEVLDVTESRVSQLHTQAILKLKGKISNKLDEPGELLSA